MRQLNNIKKAREAKGMSQAQVAVEVPKYVPGTVSQQAVAKWENGDALPRSDKLIAIAKVLGCTVDELLREETA